MISTSHSGNTEETIEATEIALKPVLRLLSYRLEAYFLTCRTPLQLLLHTLYWWPATSFCIRAYFARQLALFRGIGILPDDEDDEIMLERLQSVVDDYDFIAKQDPDFIELISYIATQPIALLGLQN